MNKAKREALEAAGFKVGDYGDFLGLTDAERQVVELRVQLARQIREKRKRAKMTQEELATAMDSTQPGIARIEAAGRGVSLDRMWRAYFAVGGKLEAIFQTEGARKNRKKAKAVGGASRKNAVDA